MIPANLPASDKGRIFVSHGEVLKFDGHWINRSNTPLSQFTDMRDDSPTFRASFVLQFGETVLDALARTRAAWAKKEEMEFMI